MRDLLRDHSRLARTRAGDNQQRALSVLDGLFLRLIKCCGHIMIDSWLIIQENKIIV